jgi:hypothetical protein
MVIKINFGDSQKSNPRIPFLAIETFIYLHKFSGE